MNLQQIVMTSFVLLQSTWLVENSRQLTERLKPSHVIVHLYNQRSTYYLFSNQEVLALFAQALDASSVDKALRLNERSVTPTMENDTDAEQVPDQCIVLEEDRLAGFFDVTVSPQWTSRKGGDESISSQESLSENQSLVADFPKYVPLQTVFSLLVSISSLYSGAASKPLLFSPPPGTKVDILIQAIRGFALEGKNEGTVVITGTNEEASSHFQFKLRGTDVGQGQVHVLAFYQGQLLGKLTANIDVLEAVEKENTSAQRLTRDQPLNTLSRRQPDLSLLILEHMDGGQPALTFYLSAHDPELGLNLKSFGPRRLKTDVLRYFQDFFRDIETLPLHTRRDIAITEQRLAAKGTELFTSLLPPELQMQLWSLRSRIQSVQVQSQEPWIPWEICKLQGQENGRVVDGPFLCEAFTVSRWIPGIPVKPSLKLDNIAVVVPHYTEPELPNLRCAPLERNYLLSLASEKRQVTSVPATFLELRDALASGLYDGWHFSGHGGFRESNPDLSVMYLENREKFTPEDLSGVVSNLGVTKPLVFLNACQIGRSAMSLTDIGGWARRFLYAGAGAFIGAYWSVYDQSAYDFAKELYSRLLIGIPIGKAVQQARAAIKPTGSSTWLAYTVFADPLATVQE